MLEEAKWTKLTSDNAEALYDYDEHRVVICKPDGDCTMPPTMKCNLTMSLSSIVKFNDGYYFYIIPDLQYAITRLV